MNVDKLRSMFPKLVVRNLRPYMVHIPYQNGDSVSLQPNETAKITTDNLSQVPNPFDVELVQPTLSVLIANDILSKQDLGVKPSGDPAPTPAAAPAAVSSPRRGSNKPRATITARDVSGGSQ